MHITCYATYELCLPERILFVNRSQTYFVLQPKYSLVNGLASPTNLLLTLSIHFVVVETCHGRPRNRGQIAIILSPCRVIQAGVELIECGGPPKVDATYKETE